jgi:hypothetical protein
MSATTLTPSPPTRPPTPGRRRGGRGVARKAVIALAAPALIAAICVAALFGAAGNPPCESTTGGVGPGMFAAPLTLQAGQRYQVGATEYGGPEDPSSGSVGSSGVNLAEHPDSFAELSLLNTNPIGAGQPFTFNDANALNELPYGTAIRVRSNGHELVLDKEDVGYGQGPGQTLPYRIDVWWQAAAELGITKNPVSIQLAPSSGSGGLLNQLGSSDTGSEPSGQAASCTAAPGGPLPITSGPVALINPITGIASAPAGAPRAVKLAIAAANQIIDTPYIWGGGHANLNTTATGYDCSGASAYVLHQAGLYPPSSGPTAADFEHYYPSGPGRWITVYANAVHMWIQVAGIVLNTAWYAPIEPTDPTSGPRWQPGATAQEQIAGNAAAGNPPFSVTHPQGL